MTTLSDLLTVLTVEERRLPLVYRGWENPGAEGEPHFVGALQKEWVKQDDYGLVWCPPDAEGAFEVLVIV